RDGNGNSAFFLAELKAGLCTTTVEVWLLRYWEARRFVSEAGPITYIASHHRLTSTTTLQVRRNPNHRGSTEETLQKAWVTRLRSDPTNMIRKVGDYKQHR
ncbi:unnamed protein product, partial [Brassica napus]